MVISAWKSGSSNSPTRTPATGPHLSRSTATPPLLSLKALRGATHVIAHAGSATGKVAYDGTIQPSDGAVAIRGSRLWVSIDTPENLRIEIRGAPVHVPGPKPQVIVVTATGWHPA